MVPKTDPLDFDLYPVTCASLSAGRSNLEVLDGLIAGGAKVVQLRSKDLADRDLFNLATEFRRRTYEAGMTLIINDRVDICMAVQADGVHLGQDDFPIPEARRLLGPQAVIGASTHNLDEALQAVSEGASTINVGPIYATQTKAHLAGPVGIDLFQKIKDRVTIPITVMGGIKIDNVDPLLAAGARRIAVVTAVTAAPDVAAAVRQFRQKILSYR